MGLTADMGRFVAALRYDMLPAEAVKTVRLGFTDCIACMITGWNEPVTRTAARGLGIAHDDLRPGRKLPHPRRGGCRSPRRRPPAEPGRRPFPARFVGKFRAIRRGNAGQVSRFARQFGPEL